MFSLSPSSLAEWIDSIDCCCYTKVSARFDNHTDFGWTKQKQPHQPPRFFELKLNTQNKIHFPLPAIKIDILSNPLPRIK